MYRRRAAANETLLNDLIEGSKRERVEQETAQIAALSCEVSIDTIKKGLHNTVSDYLLYFM
ncbi:hypothetical protein EON65_38565 [archaeon]|nr:MAG: hypothetical protein EON65_38565 [archaeon]